MLQIREKVAAGTYRVAVEDVADAIMAGPVPLGEDPERLVGGVYRAFGGFGPRTDPAHNNDDS